MAFKNNLVTTPNNTYKEYKLENGIFNVNLSKNEIIVQIPGLVTGTNTYEMGYINVFSNYMHESATSLGYNFKLSVEERIYPYSASMNLDGFNEGDYVYVDGSNHIHRFVHYGGYSYTNQNEGGDKLIVLNGYQIQKSDNSVLNFNSSGYLINHTYKGNGNVIRKVISYDSLNRVIKYYDDRKSNKYISFEYIGSNVSKAAIYENGKIKEYILYRYNGSLLTGIFHYKYGNLLNITLIKYDSNNVISEIVQNEGTALICTLTNNVVIEIGRSQILKSGYEIVLGENSNNYSYIGDNEYLNDVILIENNPINEINEYDFSYIHVDEVNNFYYYSNYTDVQANAITETHYFNHLGTLTASFENINGGLISKNKHDGIALMKDSDSSGINNKKIIQKGTTNYFVLTDSSDPLSDEFNSSGFLAYLASNEFKTSYKLSFYVKINPTSSSGTFKMRSRASARNIDGYYKSVENVKYISLKDKNTWHYIEMPIEINHNYTLGIRKLELMGSFSEGSGLYEISDIRLAYSNTTDMYYKRSSDTTDLYPLSTATGFEITSENGTTEINFSDEVSFSLDDLINTLKSKKADTLSFGYDFVYNNGKNRIYRTSSIKIVDQNNKYNIYPEWIYIVSGYHHNINSLIHNTHFEMQDTNIIKIITKKSSASEQITIKDLQGRLFEAVSFDGLKTVNEYDSYGNLLSSTTANKNAFDSNNKFDKSKGYKRYYLNYEYDNNSDDGKYRENIVFVKNEENERYYEYNKHNKELLDSLIDNKTKYMYSYDTVGRMIKLQCNNNYNNISYENNHIKYLSNQSNLNYRFDNEYEINSSGLSKDKTTAYFNNTAIVEIDNTNIKKPVLTNKMLNNSITYEYDSYNRLFKKGNYRYTYNKYNQIDSIYGDLDEVYNYEYNRLKNVTYSGINNYHAIYTEENPYLMKYCISNITHKRLKLYNDNKCYSIIHLDENNNEIDNYSVTYSYDIFNNVIKKEGSKREIIINYENKDKSLFYSNYLTEYTHIEKVNHREYQYSYEYEDNKIIKKYCSGADHVGISYAYDEFNRIYKEGHLNQNVDFEYSYDSNNNLISVKKNGSIYKNFTYDSNNRLTRYENNGIIKSVSYNANSLYPLTYNGNGMLFNAEGLITQYGAYQFTYNHKGLRVRKYNLNTGEYTLYYYDENDNIIGEDYSDSIKIRYMYDNEGIIGARFINGSIITNYEYILDGFKNVTGILNNGVQVAKYEYDAFGDLIYSYTNDYFSQINPIRYRGYYYDIETGLFMVGHRYYNPEWGRWLSPDDVEYLEPNNINGLNLYCYCQNNPIWKSQLYVFNKSLSSVLVPEKTTNINIPFSILSKSSSNFWRPHWQNKWFDTGWPGFFVLSNEGFEVLNWSLSIYKGSLYFDNNEEHSIYVSVGNIGAYAGINYKKGIGLDVSANVAEIGYDGRIIDANLEGLSIGFTYMYKDGKLELKHGYGWWGWSLSIDFVELWKCLFGGK